MTPTAFLLLFTHIKKDYRYETRYATPPLSAFSLVSGSYHFEHLLSGGMASRTSRAFSSGAAGL